MTTAISGRSASIVRSDSSPSTTSQPLAGRRVAPELRDLAADQIGGIEPELREDEGDHPRRRRLPVRAGDDDRAPERDELGEELRARPPLHLLGVRGRDDRLPALAHDRLRAQLRARRLRARGDTASRPDPSRRPPHPTRARGRHTTRGPRRRFRRTRSGGRRAGGRDGPARLQARASAISSSAISSAAPGRAIASIAARIAASRSASASSSSTSAGTRSSSASGTTIAPPPRSK